VNSFGRVVRAGAVSKMLSCDPRLALCTFVQLVCPALPCRFVSVVRAPMQNRSGGSFEGTRVNSIGRVVRVGRSGGSFEGARVNSFRRVVRARAVSKMLSCDPRLALCTFVPLVCPALPCRFVSVVRAPMKNRLGGSFEGARVNSFGRVVRVGRSGGSFGWVVRAGRLRAPV
jgi:hypothetical protein